MHRQTSAFTHPRNLARPLRLRLITDAEGYPAIPGRYGRLEWFNGRDLAVYCDRARLFATAKALGLTIPPSVLARADEVIE